MRPEMSSKDPPEVSGKGRGTHGGLGGAEDARWGHGGLPPAERSHLKVFLPRKLVECLPKCPVLPKEQLRWNTNEVGSVGGSQGGMWGHGNGAWNRYWNIQEALGDVGGDIGVQGRIKGTQEGVGWVGGTGGQGTSGRWDSGVTQQVGMGGQGTQMRRLSPQEIASYLITFEKHDEWLSCSPKTRWGGPGGALRGWGCPGGLPGAP